METPKKQNACPHILLIHGLYNKSIHIAQLKSVTWSSSTPSPGADDNNDGVAVVVVADEEDRGEGSIVVVVLPVA